MRIPWGSSLLGTHDHAGIQQTSTSFLFIGVILIRKIRRSQQKKYCGSGTFNPEVGGLRFEIRLQLPSTLFQARSDRLMKINIWKAGDQRKEWEERVGGNGSHRETAGVTYARSLRGPTSRHFCKG